VQEAAASLTPFICIVDGLNESAPYAGSNVLDLPAHLPPGFFVVASTQPVPTDLTVECPIDYISLDDYTIENRIDIVEYVRNILRDVPESTVESIVDHAEGNWAYVFFVVGEIADGTRSPLDISYLPRGIWQYYSRFWRSWREKIGRDAWIQKDLPLLTSIAAALEILPVATIAELCGVDPGYADDLISTQWLRFVVIENRNAEAWIRPFNSSLIDFVHGKVDEKRLSESERAFVRQLQNAMRSIHREIAERYLKLWGNNLLALRQNSELTKANNRYGWRYAVGHLIRGEMFEEGMNLIRTEWNTKYRMYTSLPGIMGYLDMRRRRNMSLRVSRNAWFESHLRAGDIDLFLMDLEALLKDIYERHNDLSVHRILDTITVLGMRRCALEVMEALPPAVLVNLARHGDWSPEQLLQFTNRVEDPHTKARLLIQLLEFATGSLTEILEVNALETVNEVPIPDLRLQLIEALLPHLHGGRLEQARKRAFDLLTNIKTWPSETLLSNIIHSLQPREWELFEEIVARFSPIRRVQLSLALLSGGAQSKRV
jgi:hypothetical protein